MSKRDIGREILEGIEDIKAWQRGEATLRTREVTLPTAADVATIRERLALSQETFSAFLGVSVGTVRNWEQGRREPQGPAKALLLVARHEPAAFKKAWGAAARSSAAPPRRKAPARSKAAPRPKVQPGRAQAA